MDVSRRARHIDRTHAACGFVPTDDKPVNCWGETETGCVLWRYIPGGTGEE